MNEFENRWQQGVAAVRRAAGEFDDAAPLGFATRVVAQWQAMASAELPLSLLWQRLALRVLGAMALIFLTLAAYEALFPDKDAPLQPHVENAVADSFWLL